MIKKILKENYIYIILIVLLVIGLSIIMNLSIQDSIVSFDHKFINFMNRYNNETVSSILKFITNFGDFYIPLFILVCIFIFVKNKYYFFIEAGGYLIADIITYISKLLASRSRPLEALIKIPNSYSFPSGHTLTSIVFYGLLFYLISVHSSRPIKIISFIICLLIICVVAISRIYLGVHYFTDVVGGFIIGIPCLMMIINIIEKNFKEKL